jgi:hypothetical protein
LAIGTLAAFARSETREHPAVGAAPEVSPKLNRSARRTFVSLALQLSQKYTNSQENYRIVIDTSPAAPDVAVRKARDGMGLALWVLH